MTTLAWDSRSKRRAELPADWSKIRQAVLERDQGRCQWPLPFGGKCGVPGNEVDHRRGRHDHGLSNLWVLCSTHHQRKTQQEAAAARPGPVGNLRRAELHPNVKG